MLIGMVIFCVIAFFLNNAGTIEPIAKDLDHPLQVIVITLAAAGFFIGNNYFRKKVLQEAQVLQLPRQKVALYRHASIVQWALLEGPAIFSIISFLITGNFAFLALAATVMLLFAMAFPAKHKMALLLSLTENDVEDL